MSNKQDRISMKLNFAERIRAGYITAFVLLLLSYVLILYTSRQLKRQGNWLTHTNEVLGTLETLLSNINQEESDYRGQLLLKDTNFVQHIQRSHAITDSLQRRLSFLTSDNAIQQIHLDSLGHLLGMRYALLQNGIAANIQNLAYNDSLRTYVYRSSSLMDSIRFEKQQIQQNEMRLLDMRTHEMDTFWSAINVMNVTSLVLAVLIAVYSLTTFSRENSAKNGAYQQMVESQEMLELKVEDLKKANKELVELKRLEKFTTAGRLARTIAHEVRNPLTNIGLAADQLKSEIVETEDTSALLEMISRNGSRINQLITELLNSTKFAELNYEDIEVNQLVDEALMLASDRIRLKNITVQKDYVRNSCIIAVDVNRMKVALLNIIVNAVEAMDPNSGVLLIKTEKKDKNCIVSITDNGPGMDKETVSRLFEPYFTKKQGGNGLGLTNAQNVVLNHKGTIEVESELKKGTTFTICLGMG